MKIKGLVGACTAALLISACSHDAPERMASLQAFAPTQQVATQWAVKVGKGTRGNFLRLNPSVRGGTIYAADYDGHILAVNRFCGEVVWHTEVDAHLSSGVGVGSDKVVVGGNNGQVFAMNQGNGRMLWRAHVPGEVLATPTVSHNIAYVKTASGQLFAFDATNGRAMWQYRIENPSLILRGDSAVVTQDGLAIAGFADGSVVAFDEHSGRRVWERQLAVPHGMSAVERMVDITSNLKVVDGTVYVASYQGRIAALRVSDGSTKWQRDFSAHAGLTVGPRAVYASDANSHVWAFARNNGQVLWHNDMLEGRSISGPAQVNCAIVVGDKQGYTHWLDTRDGHFVARKRVDRSRIDAAPVAVNPMVYVYSSRGELLGYKVG